MRSWIGAGEARTDLSNGFSYRDVRVVDHAKRPHMLLYPLERLAMLS